VTADAIFPFHFQIGLLDFFQQGRIVPGSAIRTVVHSGATHRFKIFRVFFLIDILRFINFQKKVRGIPDDICVLSAERKNGRGIA